jgi:tRNA nucleotidyltransferase (CCA-adding enzyme)
MLDLAMNFCKAVAEKGGRPYFTGGYVRDKLLGVPSKDVDLEIFDLTALELESIMVLFGNVNFVGKQYGIYKLAGLDIGLPRRERKTGVKHTEFQCTVDPHMSIREAAIRRDFTMNAIYYDPIDECHIDPFNGIQDLLCEKTIKHVDAYTFVEDPLRPIRAARFRAVYPFLSIADDTRKLCHQMPRDPIADLPIDRVFGELEKVLMKAKSPSVFFHALESIYLLETVFPELARMRYIDQGKKWHPEGSVYNHTLLALDVLSVGERELDVMLALLYHDLGKELVHVEVDGDAVRFKGHAFKTANAIKALRRVTLDGNLTDSVLSLVQSHMRPYDFKKDSVRKKHIRRLATEVDVPKLVKVHYADKAGRGDLGEDFESKVITANQILDLYHEIKDEIKPLMSGRDLIDLGMKPSKEFSEILKVVYNKQLDEELATLEECIYYVKVRYLDQIWGQQG